MTKHIKKYDTLIEEIFDEIADMKKYAKEAIKYKNDDMSLSDTYYELAKQEHNHARLLIDHAAKVASTDETLSLMWEHERSRIIDCLAKAKNTLDMVRD